MIANLAAGCMRDRNRILVASQPIPPEMDAGLGDSVA